MTDLSNPILNVVVWELAGQTIGVTSIPIVNGKIGVIVLELPELSGNFTFKKFE